MAKFLCFFQARHTTSRMCCQYYLLLEFSVLCLWAWWMELLFSHYCYFRAFLVQRNNLYQWTPHHPLLGAALEVITRISQLSAFQYNFFCCILYFYTWLMRSDSSVFLVHFGNSSLGFIRLISSGLKG